MAGKGRIRGRRGDTEGGKKLEEARNRRIRGLGIGWVGGGLEGIRDMEDSVHGSLFLGGGEGAKYEKKSKRNKCRRGRERRKGNVR